MESIQILTALTSCVGIFTSVLYARRAKKAKVKADEAEARAKEIENTRNDIANAELMIELVKKANDEAAKIQQHIVETLKQENEKFKKYVAQMEKYVGRLEKAFRSIHKCPHRSNCPVYAELQNDERNGKQTELFRRSSEGSDPRHFREDQGG